MKKIIIVLLLTVFLAAAGFAQDFNNPQIIEELGLTQQQIEQLRLIYEEAQIIIRDAQLDIGIEKAHLKKELAQKDVDIRQVERLLESISGLEYRLRLADLTCELKVRDLIGNRAWALLNGNGVSTRTREVANVQTRDRTTQDPDSQHDQKSDSKNR